MPRTTLHRDKTLHRDTAACAFMPGEPPARSYLVMRRDDAWFIEFDGGEYGPYCSEREAKLFAVDAAHTLGQQGEQTQVRILDENGETQLVWTYGHDPYPPRV
jgi:hypothetical protein